MKKEDFRKLVSADEILLLDGATGTNLYASGMPRGISTELWNLEHPETLTHLQQAYVNAGSKIVCAPTFSANEMGLAMFGLQDRMEELNRKLVELSKKAVDGRAFVAGDMSSLGKPLTEENDLSFDKAYDIYCRHAEALVRAGVDLILAETLMGVEESMAVLQAAQAVCDLPVLCTQSVASDGTAIFDGTAAEAAEVLTELGADAVGINCSAGPDQLEAVVSTMRSKTDLPLIAKPNAGMPIINARGAVRYSMSAGHFASAMQRLSDLGADILGGCCGTTPEYIAALRENVTRR